MKIKLILRIPIMILIRNLLSTDATHLSINKKLFKIFIKKIKTFIE